MGVVREWDERPFRDGPIGHFDGGPEGALGDVMVRCPYYRVQKLGEPSDVAGVGLYGPGTCSGGCVDEPGCMTGAPPEGWGLMVPDGVGRCPQCTRDYWGKVTDQLPALPRDGLQVTTGCQHCHGTGHKFSFSFVGELIGGHVHVRLWAGEHPHRGNSTGVRPFILRPEEWEAFKVLTDSHPMLEAHDAGVAEGLKEKWPS